MLPLTFYAKLPTLAVRRLTGSINFQLQSGHRAVSLIWDHRVAFAELVLFLSPAYAAATDECLLP